jgi:hypothetical protein
MVEHPWCCAPLFDVCLEEKKYSGKITELIIR